MNRIDRVWLRAAASALATLLCHLPGLAAPDVPALQSPEASLKSFKVRDGFTVELVAAEPLVVDPISLDWGPDGKLWVVEMADYPLGIDGNGKPGGRVRFLEDTDGDGEYDKSTLFLDGLAYPSGVMVWRKGVLVSAAPDVIYAEDTDGDGRADRRKVLFRGFMPGNPQHRVNGFSWGLDNWVYLANGDSGGVVSSQKTLRSVAIRGRDLRIRPDTGSLDAQTGQTQFGRSRDDWGNWFGTANSQPIMHFVLADHRLRRNPHVAAPLSRVTIASSLNTALFPISRVTSHAADYHSPAPGEPHRFTAACSTIVYRDDLFGEEFANNTFTCEPAHNIVHRRILEPSGLTFTSQRTVGEEQAEFLASTDRCFRPTAVRTGPDGALWVVDMYRSVIEHPEYIDDRLEETLDLRTGHEHGRIYRVYPADQRPRSLPRLDQLDTAGLVAALDSPSGWQRDRAQQMLIWRSDRSATAELTRMASEHRQPRARLHALCTLDGLNTLSPDVITECLADAHPAVRRHAVRLFETLVGRTAASEAALLQRANDDDAHVRLEYAYALGQWNDARAGRALGRMAVRCADNPYLFAGVMSSVNPENLDQVLAEVFVSEEGKRPPGRLIRQLLSVATSLGDNTVLIRVLGIIGTPQGDECDAWQLSALGEVLDALDRRKFSLADPSSSADPETRSALHDIAKIFESARRIAVDSDAEPARRLLAVKLLGRGPGDGQDDVLTLGQLLVPQSSPDLQLTIVESLGKLADERIPQVMVAQWKQHGTQLRRDILDVLLSRKVWRLALLDCIEQGPIQAAEIDASRRYRLLTDENTFVKQRAQRLFATAVADSSRAQVVAAHQSILSAPGDRLRGALVFENKCATCHRIGNLGHAVGPDLLALVNRSPKTVLTAILDPNQAVAAKYKAYAALTTDGRQFTGMLGNETSHDITLLGLEGKRQTILRTELESLLDTGTSFMPEGMEKDLTHGDLADVVAYVMSAGAPPKQFAGNDPQRITADSDGCLRLSANHASVHGDTLIFRKKDRSLGYWKDAGDRAVWSLNVTGGATYAVFMDYAMAGAPTRTDNRFAIDAARGSLTGQLDSTGDANRYQQVLQGYLYLGQGDSSFSMSVGSSQAAVLNADALRINLRNIWLVPLSDADANSHHKALSGNAPRLVRPGRDGEFHLPVTISEICGDGAQFEPQQENLAFWSTGQSRATWTLNVPETATFLVFLNYACGRNPAGTSYTISSGGDCLSRRILGTGSWREYRQRFVGKLNLEAGVRRLSFHCAGASDGCLIDLREISLVRDFPSGRLGAGER